MEVILLETVNNLGKLGDLVKVANGYARNFLFPRGKASRATPAVLKAFEQRRAELEKIQLEKLQSAQSIAQRLNQFQLKVSQKASADGRLFGSVTHIDIIQGLKKAGFENIEKTHVRLPEAHLKMIGTYPVQIILHPDLSTEITLTVEGESS